MACVHDGVISGRHRFFADGSDDLVNTYLAP